MSAAKYEFRPAVAKHMKAQAKYADIDQEDGESYEDGASDEDEDGSSNFLIWMAALGAEVHFAVIGWLALIAYWQTFYWHALNPQNLGMDTSSMGTYFVVMVFGPLLLEIPFVSRIFNSNGHAVSLVLAAFSAIAVLCGTRTEDERQRSTLYLVAVLCVMLRLVAVGVQPIHVGSQLATERALAPWGALLGLLGVLVGRLGFTHFHQMRGSNGGAALFVIISVVSLGFKSFRGPVRNGDDMHDETLCKGCGPALVAGMALSTLLMLALWLLDAPWAVAHFVGLHGSAYRFLFVLSFAVGIGHIMWINFLPRCLGTGLAHMKEIFLGGLLLCVPVPSVSFIGGCLVAVGFPGALLFALEQCSSIVHGRAAGRTLSFAAFMFFMELFIYMGTLMGNVPLFSSIFWSKFWLFTLLMLLCLVGLFVRAMSGHVIEWDLADSAISCKTKSLWLGILTVSAIVLSAEMANRSYLTPQQTARGLVVGTFNVQQGYRTDGKPNFECVASVLQQEQPHVVGLQESDSVHVVSGNINVLGYVADKVGLHRTVGPIGREASVGVSIVSQYELKDPQTQIMPAAEEGALNRFLTRSTITVNGTDIVVFSTHTEWFGDPAVQIGFIASQVAAVDGPVVVVGDFNLDRSGQNDATIAANITTNGFQPLIDLAATGLKSVTDIKNKDCAMVTLGGIKYCPGTYTTVDMGSDTTPGYQLDYIWYRGLVQVGDASVSALSKGCSDHMFFQAAFQLP